MKIRNILFFVSSICLMASCSDLLNVDHTGESIKFGASSGKKELLTRTEYTDDVRNGRERIDWTNNDRVYIWMYWDEDRNGSYESGPLSTEYMVEYNSYYQEKSYGSLISTGTSLRWQGDFSGNNGRAREYKHAFYSVYPSVSVYPSMWREFNGNNVKFNIPNSQKGVDMSLAYMTAYKDNVTSLIDDNNPYNYVYLEYYPRVTTLYITVVNDTDETVGGEIKLSSSNSPITGDYFVSIPDYSSGESGNNNEGGKEVTNTIKSLAKNASDIVAFFIRPRNYASGELSLTFNGKTQSLNKALEPNYKYNIQITVSGNKPPTFKETIGNGEAQFLILWITNYLKDSAFNDFFGFDQNGDHRYGEFNDRFINNKYGDVWNGNTAEQFLDFFTEEQLNKFYNRLLTETKFETTNKQITSPIHKEFFSLFPNLEEVYIQTRSTIEISNLEHLKSATFEYASEVTITGCDALTSITLKNTPDIKKFTLSKCKSVTTFDMTNPETWTPNAEYTFDTMDNLSSVKLCSAKEVNVYDCENLPDENISMKNSVSINRTRK